MPIANGETGQQAAGTLPSAHGLNKNTILPDIMAALGRFGSNGKPASIAAKSAAQASDSNTADKSSANHIALGVMPLTPQQPILHGGELLASTDGAEEQQITASGPGVDAEGEPAVTSTSSTDAPKEAGRGPTLLSPWLFVLNSPPAAQSSSLSQMKLRAVVSEHTKNTGSGTGLVPSASSDKDQTPAISNATLSAKKKAAPADPNTASQAQALSISATPDVVTPALPNSELPTGNARQPSPSGNVAIDTKAGAAETQIPVQSDDVALTQPTAAQNGTAGKSKRENSELAFAMRLASDQAQPAEAVRASTAANAFSTTSNVQATPNAQTTSSAQRAALIAIEEPVKEKSAEASNHGPAFGELVADTSSGDSASARITQKEQSAPSQPVEQNADASQSATNEPVKSVHVQVTGENNQRVNLHMVDQAGEIRLSVRSSDPSLAQSLQDHIPELTNRLQEQHFRAEVWTPRVASSAETSEARSGSSTTGDESSRANRDSGDQSQQQGGQRQRPSWLDDLEDYPIQNQITGRF